MSEELTPSPFVTAFLAALPLASDDQFVTVPGLGMFRAKFVRRGLDRGVVVVHWTGRGFAIAQPDTHGVCAFCKGVKGSQPCEHCACAMCTWFRQTEERASPRVSRAKLVQLAARLKVFQFAGPPIVTAPTLDDDI